MAVFPLAMSPQHSYKYGGISFGASSKNRGTRRHAACDLVVPPGTPVFAVESGLVTSVPKTSFFQDTYTITIQHPWFVIRYAELDIERCVKEGDYVFEGQQIGTVGKNYKDRGMLHFEMYRGTASGALSQKSNDHTYDYVPVLNYQRRKDLMDPTPYLDQWLAWSDPDAYFYA